MERETKEVKMIRFRLNGCDIFFDAEAPADITLEQLLKQADRIKPMYCACGIRSMYEDEDELNYPPEIRFTYDDVIKLDEDAACEIREVSE